MDPFNRTRSPGNTHEKRPLLETYRFIALEHHSSTGLSLTRRLCPMCRSDRIMLWMGGYTGMMYRCPDCGYVGPVTIETDANFPKENDEKSEKQGG